MSNLKEKTIKSIQLVHAQVMVPEYEQQSTENFSRTNVPEVQVQSPNIPTFVHPKNVNNEHTVTIKFRADSDVTKESIMTAINKAVEPISTEVMSYQWVNSTPSK